MEVTIGDKNYVGAGHVLFNRFDAQGEPTGYRHLRNVDTLNLATTVTKIEKKSAMDGARQILKEVVTGTEAEVTLVLSEYDKENLALAFRGDTAAFTQAADPGLTAQEINNGEALSFDVWYDLGKEMLSDVEINQNGSPLTITEDYLIDLEVGMVCILSTGGGAEAVTTWDGDAAAIDSTTVRGLNVGKILGSLRFISAENQAAGPRFKADIHLVELAPDGELPFISEEFGSFTLKGKAQKDSSQAAGEEFFTVRELVAASLSGS
jgi:hypothetical protein